MATSVVGEIAAWSDTTATQVTTARLPWTIVAASGAPAKVKALADYVCDGTADEVQINAALAVDDKRPIVLIGPTFTTAGPIQFADGIKHDLIASNPDYTEIKADHTGNALEIHSASLPQEWRITVDGLHLNKGATNTPARGLSLVNCAYVRFRNVRVRNCTVNLYHDFALWNTYENCTVSDGGTGLYLTGAAGKYSNYNEFWRTAFRANDVGIDVVQRTERNTWRGCAIEDLGTNDIGVRFGSDATVQSHAFEDCWFEMDPAATNCFVFVGDGGRRISIVRPRFALASTQAVFKTSGFAGRNWTVVDPHVDDGRSFADLPAGITVISHGDNREFNVTAFGAVVDGTTDDTLAVQRAINALGTVGGTITGPKGTYLLSRQGAISHDSMGTGYCLRIGNDTEHGPVLFSFPPGTIFKLANNQTANTATLLIDGSSTSYRTSPTVVRWLDFDGNWGGGGGNNADGTSWTDHGVITGVYAADIHLDGIELRNYPLFGLHFLRDCRGFRMTHCRIDGTHGLTEGKGASLRIESSGAHIEGNVFIVNAFAGRSHISAGDNADVLMQMHGLRITGNEFHGGFNGGAVALDGVSHSFVTHNLFRDVCDTSGWALKIGHYTNANGTFWDSTDNLIADNIFFNVRQGILLSGQATNNFSYSNPGGSGTTAYGAGAVRNKVKGNIITRNPDDLRTRIGDSATYPARVFGGTYIYSQAPNADPVNLATGIQEAAVSKFTGTATAGAAATLTDSGKTFTTTGGGMLGWTLTLTGGTGAGQRRTISSNTATVATVGQAWDTVPDATTTYEITDPTGANEIVGNTIVATSNSTTGISITSPSAETLVFDNVVYNTTTPFSFRFNRSRGNRAYKGNITGATSGFTTPIYADEGQGTGTIASGGTSVTITHKLGRTPTAEQIRITPTNSPTNDPGTYWVDTIGATTFAVNVRADPGASGATFAWSVVGNP